MAQKLAPTQSALSTWLQQVNRELGPDGSCSPHRPFDLQDTGTFATALQSSGFLFIKNFRNMQQRRNVSLDFKLLLTVCDVKAPDLAALVAALLEGKVDDSFPLEKW